MTNIGTQRRLPSAMLAVAAVVLAACGAARPVPAAPATSTTRPTVSTVPVGAALAVKIDNIDAARPATGLGSAEAIYVEQVEGGLTRIIAVFGPQRPAVIGPVRSARTTDLDLLAQYGRPTFAYSGSAPALVPALRSASVVNASPTDVPGAYFRDPGRAAPHNLYVRPALLPTGVAPAADVLSFGAAPAGGTPATDQRVTYPAASYEFRWSPAVHRWLVLMDGTPFRSTDAGQLGAATVVVQHVQSYVDPVAERAGDVRATPVYRTVGSGTATVLRDGMFYSATWSRPQPATPTRFTVAASGLTLPFAAGPVWVLLVGTS